MKRISRDAWLAIGLMILFLVVTFSLALQQAQPPAPPPYSSRSAAPDGALALARWLKQIGFQISSDVGLSFAPPDGAALVVILQPSEEISDADWELLDHWVSGGGTLLLAGDNFVSALAVDHLHFSMSYLAQPQDTLSIQAPLLVSPPIPAAAVVHDSAYLTSSRNDFVVHMAASAHPVLVSFDEGKGRLLISTAPYPFSNDGLKETTNPQLILNLVTAIRRTGGIWIDEWHHGERFAGAETGGPENWLFGTFGGRALLYGAVVVFIALLLQGRAFGKPLPPVREFARRAPLEYITAIANLNRRAGHRRALLLDYHHRLKRELGRRYRLSPALDDAEFVRQIAFYRPDLNSHDLSALLARLQQPGVGENEVVELAARVAGWLEEKAGGPA